MTGKRLMILLVLWTEIPKTMLADEAYRWLGSDTVEFFPSENITTSMSNVSRACHLGINQTSLETILRSINREDSNAIELKVLIESFNNSSNKSRVLTGITWASKMGRAMISLINQADNISPMILSSYTSTLTPAVSNVDIIIYEKTDVCSLLYLKNNEMDIYFEFLQRQLYVRGNDYSLKYELCRKDTRNTHEKTKYKCCNVVGPENIPICSDYSSILLVSSEYFIVGAMYLFLYLALPLLADQLMDAKKEAEEYKISDSPMSISSIFQKIFIKGHSPLKSFGRRFVFAVFVLVTSLPELNLAQLWLYIVSILWALLFLFFDAFNLNEAFDCEYDEARFYFFLLHGNPIKIIALPFNLKFLWKKMYRQPFSQKYLRLNVTPSPVINDYQSLQSARHIDRNAEDTTISQVDTTQVSRSGPQVNKCDVIKYCASLTVLLAVYLVLALPILTFSCFFGALYIGRFIAWLSIERERKRLSRAKLLIDGSTLLFMILSTKKCVALMFYFITGLFLNAYFYGPYFVPISIILFYSWRNWKSFVEEKYLELKTQLFNVCRNESHAAHLVRPLTESEDRQYLNINDNSNDISRAATLSTSRNKRFTIKTDESGEPVIPKPLYDIVRETFLPYDEILIPYITGVFSVAVFAYFISIFMALAQASGISSIVQVISTTVVTSLPFLFDIIWKKNSSEQKAANTLALQSKLEHILIVLSPSNSTKEIVVEFTGTMPRDPFGNHASWNTYY